MKRFLFELRVKQEGYYLSLFEGDDESWGPKLRDAVKESAVCFNCKTPISNKLKPCDCNKPYDENFFCMHELQINKEFIGIFFIPYDIAVQKISPLIQEARNNIRSQHSSKVRKERIKNSEGKHSSQDIKDLEKIQNNKCYFCGVELNGYEVDHLIPLSHPDGTNFPENLVLACRGCNRKKYTKTDKEFWGVLEKNYGCDWVKSRKENAIKIDNLKKRHFDKHV